jgi:hypothetical protein
MKIRSITYFFNPGWPLDESKIQAAGAFLAKAKPAFMVAGYEVQTTRLVTIPFPLLLGVDKLSETPKLAEAMEAALPAAGADYAALGPALIEVPESYPVIPEAIAATQNIFFSGEMASVEKGISLKAVKACAEVIVRCSTIMPDGFANLRFAALANVGPGAAFFPAAYHAGDEPAFAIATEAADLAVAAFENAKTIDEGQKELITSLESNARKLVSIAESLEHRFAVKFSGIDFSLAPFPEESLSLGTAVERMGVPKVGLHGSLAAVTILAGAVDQALFPHAGFSGFMQPILEDAVLAKRAGEGVLTVKDMLLYSAASGTGLDTVPLPGDVTSEQIGALLLDLAALALRLDKPLTARLMPLPGKNAGDPTSFDFAYFANSRVMSLEALALKSPFSGEETFWLTPRHH